jgi:hypothetical protein
MMIVKEKPDLGVNPYPMFRIPAERNPQLVDADPIY